MLENARSLFKLIYKVGMTMVTLLLGAGAVFAYVSATPGNGLLLVSGILALLTLMAGLSIPKLDWQDEQAESYRQIGQEIRGLVQVSTRHVHSDPEVYRLDATAVDDAKRMAGAGAPLDEICRRIDPGHDRHDHAHQEAFRRIVQSMIDS